MHKITGLDPSTLPPSRIITGDVLQVLRRQPATPTFDIIIADPPYNIGKDFGITHDDMPLPEYIAWCRQWLSQCFRLLSDDGLVYVYGFPEVLAHLAVHYPITDQRWLAWHYTNKAVPSSRFWQRSHESILCLWHPGRRPPLQLEQIREPYTPNYLKCAGKPRKGTPGRFGNGRPTTYTAHQNGALPRDVLHVPALAGGAGRAERWFACRDCRTGAIPPTDLPDHADHDILKHPTQKPMQLTRRLLLSRIPPGHGHVLIPFAGSGSECVVAQSMGVQYLGIELNPEYARFGRSWLKQCIA